MNKYKNQIPRTRDLVSSLVKLSPVLRLLLSPIFFFSHARCVGCVFLCPRNARVASACGSWRATTTRALRNRLLGSKDPPARSILRTTLYIYSPRHVSLDRTDPRFPSRGTVEPSLLSRMCYQTNVPPLWFTFIIILRIFSPLSDDWSWTRQKRSRDIIHGMRFARSSTGKSNN